MPTGYTHDVQTGQIATLEAFVMRCARAFGALVTMRDDPADAPIPEEFKPDTEYHDKAIAEAKRAIEALRGLTTLQCADAEAAERAEQLAERQRFREEKALHEQRYRAMLALVEGWEPPTPEHDGIKNFMRDQLTKSLDADCGGSWEPSVRGPMEPEAWRAMRIGKHATDIEYHEERRAAEIIRVAQRNAWLTALRQSLRAQPSQAAE